MPPRVIISLRGAATRAFRTRARVQDRNERNARQTPHNDDNDDDDDDHDGDGVVPWMRCERFPRANVGARVRTCVRALSRRRSLAHKGSSPMTED